MAEKINVMLSGEEVDARIHELAQQISKDYEGKTVHLVGILNGAVFFLTELAKHITVPTIIDFMRVSSYGNGTESSGEILIKHDTTLPVEGEDVIIVEDIIDSGNTLYSLKKLFADRKVNSLRLCTLLDKPDRREVEVSVDYIGFQIPDKFVVGYGLDYAQKYRNLPYIGVVEL